MTTTTHESKVHESTYKRGDVVFVDLPKGSGSQQQGERPCVIVSNESINHSEDTYIICPVTKTESKQPSVMKVEHTYFPEVSYIHAEQIRSITKDRIIRYFNHLDEKDMQNLEVAIANQLLIPTYKLGFREQLTPRYRRGEIYLLHNPSEHTVLQALPFLVVSNDVGNHYSTVATVIPIIDITDLPAEYLKGKYRIQKKFTGLSHDSTMLLHYMNTVDVNKLIVKLGELTEGYYEVITKEIKKALAIKQKT